MPPLDASALLKMQQGSFDAFIQANRMFVETAQAIAHCQSEMMRDYAEHMTMAFAELGRSSGPDERAKAQTEIARAYFEKTAGHAREIAELIGKSSADAMGLMSSHIGTALDEAPSMAERPLQRRAAAE